MKKLKFLYFILFSCLFTIPCAVSADLSLGSSALNPVYVHVEQSESYEIKTENLKTTYGVNNYYVCYADNLNSYGCRQAALTSTPYSKDSYFLQCYTYMKSCLEQKAVDSSTKSNCATGKIYYNNQCVTPDEGCKIINGVGSYSEGYNQSTGKYDCACSSGYSIGSQGCVANIVATTNNDEANCLKYSNAVYIPSSQGGVCGCVDGYKWNVYGGGCEKNAISAADKNIVKQEKTAENVIDKNLSNKMKGKILLQVESHGEAWYVDPKTSEKHYMADGNSAYSVMRNLGIGVTNKDLKKIQTNKTFAKKNSGKIFLQVESKGEAYYIDFNGDSHYLKDGAAAYEIMRSLGLGITNDNLNKISEGGL